MVIGMRAAQFRDVFENMLRESFKPRLREMWDMLPVECDRSEVMKAGLEERLIPMALQMSPKQLAIRGKGTKYHERKFRHEAPRIMRLLLDELIEEMTR